MKKICPLRTLLIAQQTIHEFDCRDNCAWLVDGECAIAIIAKANSPEKIARAILDAPLEPNKCDMEREWLSEDEEEQNYAG